MDKVIQVLTLIGLGVLVGIGMGLSLWIIQAVGVIIGD